MERLLLQHGTYPNSHTTDSHSSEATMRSALQKSQPAHPTDPNRPVAAPATAAGRPAPWIRAALICTWATALIALAEFPLEAADPGITGAALLALCVSKGLLLALCVCVTLGMRWARRIFVVLCVTSVMAIAPHLPTEWRHYPAAFVLSGIECVMKTAAAVLLCTRTVRDGLRGRARDQADFA